jgi:hypothetical protein
MDDVLLEVTVLETNLSCPEHPIKILDYKDRVTRRKTIKFFKIQWSNHSEEEVTRESGDFLHSLHPDFELPWGGKVLLFVVPLGPFFFQTRDEILF